MPKGYAATSRQPTESTEEIQSHFTRYLPHSPESTLAIAPFKDTFNPTIVREHGNAIAAVYTDFDTASFIDQATDGLLTLELKDRVRHIATAIREHLPSDWATAADILTRALPPVLPDTSAVASTFSWWTFLTVVEVYGVADPDVSLPTLHKMTQVFSAEFAIRPLILAHPKQSYDTLNRWLTDPSPHVRRLVSEGSRPRLPWGIQLKPLVQDPSPTLPLLDALRDDPSEYVRRSVANHLNDIAKDHPNVVLEVCTRWMADATDTRTRLVRHALRTLIKAGNPTALALMGFGPPKLSTVQVSVTPDTIALGESVLVSVTCVSDTDQSLMMDLSLVRPTKTGTSTKVFKGVQTRCNTGESVSLSKKLHIRKVTTRVWYAGEHRVDMLVNGQVVGSGRFVLTLPT